MKGLQQGDPILRKGRWLVGNGFDIPLTYPDWLPNLRDSSLLPFLQTGTVGDLTDHNSRSWKVDLIRSLYHHPKAVDILQMPIPKSMILRIGLCGNTQGMGIIVPRELMSC